MSKITVDSKDYYPKYDIGDIVETNFGDEKVYDIIVGYNVEFDQLFYRIYDLETLQFEELTYQTTENKKVA